MHKKEKTSLPLTILGTMCTALAVSCFLSPNQIVGGGSTGLSIIINNLFKIPLGLANVGINIILLLLGYRIIGRKFTIRTLLGAGILSAFIHLFTFLPALTQNELIATVFGGVLYGFGIGVTFISGATTGGTDILGRILQSKFQNLPIGKLIMGVDGIIILSSYFAFRDLDRIYMGIIMMAVSTYVIDTVIKTMNVSKIAYVITDKGEEIARKIVGTSPRGVTMIEVTGAYTNTTKQMLFCAMKGKELSGFQEKVIAIDPEAFIVYGQSQQILGNGFYIYR